MENLKLQAYSIIKDKILNCEYEPNSYLSEKILIDEIGMSRTPIRDAISRLEQEGLVQILPKRGIQVSSLTFRDVNNLFEFRRLVENYAMLNHAYKIDRSEIQAFHNASMQLPVDHENAYSRDDHFHALLVQSTNNDYIIQAYANMKNQIHRLRILTGRCQSNGNRIVASRNEHIAITTAMLDGDYIAAAHALSEHLTNSYNSAFSLLTQNFSIDISSLTMPQA